MFTQKASHIRKPAELRWISTAQGALSPKGSRRRSLKAAWQGLGVKVFGEGQLTGETCGRTRHTKT